jgi:hypothetical protein
MNSRIAALLLTMVLPGCGGAPEETVTRTPPEEQRSEPSPPRETGSGQIVGFVFEDRDRNGEFTASDARMAHQTVTLADLSGRIRSATTGDDGGFRFDNLPAGGYRITLQIPDGFERMTDNSFTLSVSEDGTVREVQFGVARR